MSSIKTTFYPENISVYVLKGTKILEAAARAGIIIESPCGGEGSCGKCRVEVIEGRTEPGLTEKKIIDKQDLDKGIRLACQSEINRPSTIKVPPESRSSAQRILIAGVKNKKEIKPSIWKKYLELDKPTLNSSSADLELIREKIKDGFRTDIYIIRRLSKVLKESDYKITCVFSDNELIGIEKGDTTDCDYGVAFDIGTTTLVGTLLNANTGEELAVTSRMNPQVMFGDDVISRINMAITREDGLGKLAYSLVEEINAMVKDMAQQGKIDRKNIYKITAAGNSTMQHLLLKISPENLGSIPFSLTVKKGIDIKARKIGLDISSDGSVYVFPSIGGFVGGDTVAVILATEVYKSKDIKLVIDIGTNGEIVLGNKDRLVAAATAAGPAFEGARISQGMRASSGAIEKIVLNEDVEFNVIGNAAPVGLCGTGLIDAAAGMLKNGIIDFSGRILSRDELKGKITDKLLKRVIKNGSQNDFLLVEEKFTRTRRPIFITQKDIRELQLAKSAISAGIKILEKELGIEHKDISEILLAGAFGNFIRRSNAKRIGLIPDIPSEKIRFVGNSASSGAKLALLSEDLKKQAEEISKHTRYIELSTSSDFNNFFADEMLFN